MKIYKKSKIIMPFTTAQTAVWMALFLAFFVCWLLWALFGKEFIYWSSNNPNAPAWIQAIGSLLIILATLLPWQLDKIDRRNERKQNDRDSINLFKIYLLDKKQLESTVNIFVLHFDSQRIIADEWEEEYPDWGYKYIWFFKSVRGMISQLRDESAKINLLSEGNSIPKKYLENMIDFKNQ